MGAGAGQRERTSAAAMRTIIEFDSTTPTQSRYSALRSDGADSNHGGAQ